MKNKNLFFSNFLNPIKTEFLAYISFFKKNKLLFGLLLFILFLSFGFELSHFTLSIDEEMAIISGRNEANLWLTQGRFGITILKKIFNTTEVVPFWNTFLSITFLYLAVMYFCFIINYFLIKFNISEKFRIFLLFIFGAFFLSFPTNVAYVSFSTYNFEVSVGILIVALSVKFFINSIFDKYKISNIVLSVLLLTFAISIYQSFVLLYLCSISFLFILNILNKNSLTIDYKKSFKIILRFIFMVFISVFLYKIIDKLIAIKYPSMGYVERFIGWNKQSFIENYLSIKKYYWSDVINNTALFFYKFFFVSIIFGFVVTLYNFFLIKKEKIVYLFWSFIFFISPFLLSIVLGSATLLRTMQSVAFLSGAVWVLIIFSLRKKFFIFVLSIFSVLVIFLQTQQMSLIFYSDYSRYQQDIILANRIFNKIYNLNLGEKLKYPIVFTGRIRKEQTKENIKMETLGYSFFELDNGNTYRIYSFLKILGYDLLPPNEQQIKEALKCQEKMPSWPENDSISLCKDILVVKLSDQ